MIKWTHDELHALMESNPALKKKSDRIHALPQTDSLDDWQDGKQKMMGIYAEAVGCQNVESATAFVGKVFEHIKSHCSSKKKWFGIASLPEHKQALNVLQQEYAVKRLCCAPGGNDYVCYCDEK